MSHATLSRAFGQMQPQSRLDSDQADVVPHLARVSELAYRLWKDSGFARGTELEYWYEAEQQLLSDESDVARVS